VVPASKVLIKVDLERATCHAHVINGKKLFYNTEKLGTRFHGLQISTLTSTTLFYSNQKLILLFL
jgi:hypothetical protein